MYKSISLSPSIKSTFCWGHSQTGAHRSNSHNTRIMYMYSGTGGASFTCEGSESQVWLPSESLTAYCVSDELMPDGCLLPQWLCAALSAR